MRLTSDQIDAIKLAARSVLGDDAQITLFGSRTDDRRRGGDIDLLFETPHRLANRACELFFDTIDRVVAELTRLGLSQP